MDPLHALLLGIVQGLGEFLPISSSAHLFLTPWFLGWSDQGLEFDVALHLGTLIAVLSYYWRIWLRMGRAVLKLPGSDPKDRNLLVFVVLATIPGVVAGKLLKHHAETIFRNPLLIALTLSVMGVILWAADRFVKNRDRSVSTIRLREALLIGCAQCLALVPGFSRSGTTMTAALLLRFRREEAAHFSFLLSVPITAGAVVLQSRDIVANRLYSEPGFWIGIGSAAVVGFLAIAFLVRFVSRNSFLPFAVYRVLVAAAVVCVYLSRS